MTERERYRAVLHHEKPDRIPFQPGYGRKSTRERWHKEGLPVGAEPVAFLRQQLGIPPVTSQTEVSPSVDFLMIPQFEEIVIERRPGTLVVQDWKGNICEISDEFDVTYLRQAIDFVTRTWQKFVTQLLTKTFAQYTLDFVVINEDMAYKEKPMIGPDMGREFLLPCWREWAEVCRDTIYEVDSDGFVGSLIPVWIEAGFICNCPQEVAAGNDLPAYSRQFGKRMAYRGGVDKRAIAKGGPAIRAELARLQPAIAAGGYIPSCDHGVPSDVSWPNFVEYSKLLAKATEWI